MILLRSPAQQRENLKSSVDIKLAKKKRQWVFIRLWLNICMQQLRAMEMCSERGFLAQGRGILLY